MTHALQLPQPVASATGWALSDYREVVLTSAPAAGGRSAAAGEQLDPGELWLVDHMVASCTSTTPTTLRIYDSAEAPAALLDGSDRGNFDVADWPTGLQLQPSRNLLAVWSGASTGAVGTLRLQFRVLRG